MFFIKINLHFVIYSVFLCLCVNIKISFTTQADSLTLVKDSTKLSEKLSQYKMPMTLFNVISLGDNLYAHIKLLLPPDIVQGQRYPLVVRVYAGPGTVRVKDNFDLGEFFLSLFYILYIPTLSFLYSSV